MSPHAGIIVTMKALILATLLVGCAVPIEPLENDLPEGVYAPDVPVEAPREIPLKTSAVCDKWGCAFNSALYILPPAGGAYRKEWPSK